MLQTQATVVQKETIAPAWWQIELDVPNFSGPFVPGQFWLVRCGDAAAYLLRRPVFPLQTAAGHFRLHLRPTTDPGQAWLLSRRPGDVLDVIGPLGQGFDLPTSARNLLLVSDGPPLAPLLGLLDTALERGQPVALVLGGKRAADLYPLNLLPPAVEFYAATRDGSTGQRGIVANVLPELLGWADTLAATGSAALFHAIHQQISQTRVVNQPGFARVLAAPRLLACGVGSCRGCAVPTTSGPRLACTDGSVFDLARLAEKSL